MPRSAASKRRTAPVQTELSLPVRTLSLSPASSFLYIEAVQLIDLLAHFRNVPASGLPHRQANCGGHPLCPSYLWFLLPNWGADSS